MALGNSDGNFQILERTTAGAGLRLALLVHHTNANRECTYNRTPSIGRLDKALDEAQAQDWTAVELKPEWQLTHLFGTSRRGGRSSNRQLTTPCSGRGKSRRTSEDAR